MGNYFRCIEEEFLSIILFCSLRILQLPHEGFLLAYLCLYAMHHNLQRIVSFFVIICHCWDPLSFPLSKSFAFVPYVTLNIAYPFEIVPI